MPADVGYSIYRVIRRAYEVNLLAECGVDGKAWITHKQLFCRRGISTRHLIYTFKGPDGVNHKRHSLADEKKFANARANTGIDIVYLPDRPQINALKSIVELVRETKHPVTCTSISLVRLITCEPAR